MTSDPNHIQIVESRKSISKNSFKILKDTIAILFWTYVITKLFIFDIDIFFMNNFFPDYVQLLNYKFIILSGIFALLWLLTKNKNILLWSTYVLVFPVIVLFWKIPYFIFKQRSWILAFALLNSIISFFKSIKFSFITTSLYLASTTIILVLDSKILLLAAAITIFLILLITIIHRFLQIFKPSRIFQVHMKVIAGIRSRGIASFSLEESIKNAPIETLGERQLEKRTTNLQLSVLFNRVCLFTSKKLRDYQNSKLNFLYYVLTIFVLILITVFSFCLINYALFKTDTSLFKFSEAPSIFIFFYYSFHTILHNPIPDVIPVLPLSQAVWMINAFFALFLLVIFVSLLWTVKSEKHTEELNQIIKSIEDEGFAMESFIRSEYKINSIEEAILELEKMKAGLVKFIYKISESIQ